MIFSDDERRILRELARASIEFGLAHGTPLPCCELDYPESLREDRASFVTLRHGRALLGCIGTLRPHRPLVRDVACNGYHAAFSDRRFPPLEAAQLPGLELHVSILSALSPLEADSEAQLITRLRPGIDGVLIEDGTASATFLPVMWQRLPDPRDFLDELREKADLPRRCWSASLRVYRYTVEDA